MAKVVTAFDRPCIVRGLRCDSVTYSRCPPSVAPCPAGTGTVSVLAGLSLQTVEAAFTADGVPVHSW